MIYEIFIGIAIAIVISIIIIGLICVMLVAGECDKEMERPKKGKNGKKISK